MNQVRQGPPWVLEATHYDGHPVVVEVLRAERFPRQWDASREEEEGQHRWGTKQNQQVRLAGWASRLG